MTSPRSRRDVVVVLAVMAGLAMSCSLLVPNDPPEVHCVGDAPSSCPSNKVCVSGRCVTATDASNSDDEPAESASPVDSGDGDVSARPADIGGDCTTHVDCKSGLICGTTTMLTTSIVPTNASSMCTKTCCTSADCPSSFICFSAGTGGNYCVPGTTAERRTIGIKAPGKSCSADDECRSGLCSAGRCVDSCCSDSDCAAGTLCRVASVAVPSPSHEAWTCAAATPGATTDTGLLCSGTVPSCKNDNCSGFPQKCRPTCCTSEGCMAQGNHFAICAYGSFLTSNSEAKWCFDDDQGGPNALGATCSGDVDCASRLCDLETKTCASACCEDTNCPPPMVCRPSPVGAPLLRCVAQR